MKLVYAIEFSNREKIVIIAKSFSEAATVAVEKEKTMNAMCTYTITDAPNMVSSLTFVGILRE